MYFKTSQMQHSRTCFFFQFRFFEDIFSRGLVVYMVVCVKLGRVGYFGGEFFCSVFVLGKKCMKIGFCSLEARL